MLNQATKECFKETIKQVRRVIYDFYAKQGFLLEYKMIKDLPKCNQAIKVIYCSKILIPDGSTGLYESDYPLLMLCTLFIKD